MMRILKSLGYSLLGLTALVVGFFFWASSGTLSPEEMAQMKRYDAAPGSPDVDTFTVMTYNIGYLSGMTNNQPVERDPALFRRNMDAVLDLIGAVDPDFVGLQEIDFGATRSNNVHQLDTLATRLGYATAAQAVNWDERYLPFPYGLPSVHFGRVLSGQAILSKYPLRDHERIELARTARPFWSDAFYLDRLAQVTIADIGEQPLGIINVHLEAFEVATRTKQAREVRDIARRLIRRGIPVLLIGDFNSVMPATRDALPPAQQRAFAGDDTMPTLLNATGMSLALNVEALLVMGRNVGTFPADDPNRTIDHVLYTPTRLLPVDAEVHCSSGDLVPSDHCAVSFTFGLPRPNRPPPAADPGRLPE